MAWRLGNMRREQLQQMLRVSWKGGAVEIADLSPDIGVPSFQFCDPQQFTPFQICRLERQSSLQKFDGELEI